jgi:hypothetical protein
LFKVLFLSEIVNDYTVYVGKSVRMIIKVTNCLVLQFYDQGLPSDFRARVKTDVNHHPINVDLICGHDDNAQPFIVSSIAVTAASQQIPKFITLADTVLINVLKIVSLWSNKRRFL